ncbi:Ubiquitin carboxyl-terminal hydrolase 6 [Neolecta irregularis DAH-3]|uniref:Ubiquitin carboxyl-terminal hydrolase n=1 Tax=Neolecta irregularis (strain DAH-3) TaxID=1198029 RepID=A0A1U7LHP0_NEOID|nr:Ubiquitin carboxyl-terminal hydrolase 6 [Neolecta irregularis DAH-3]|eukprot:OLL22164.1 Ubiquitin carboxyl-terminal hydrolase 6 [Neolecta irregularis DAH-3]
MSVIPVKLKWSGKIFDVDLDTSESPTTFKMQVFSLTGVEPERMKILIKGTQMKDETDLSTVAIKPGQTLMVMGTASEIPVAPKEKIVFLEDMTENELAKTNQFPAGLVNIGNTCYLNSTVQCLRQIPELQESLQSYSGTNDVPSNLLAIFNQLSQTTRAIPPISLITYLRTAFPQFAQRNSAGHYEQQDAEEVWSQILSSMRGKVNFVEDYMTGELSSTLSNAEAEESIVSTEKFHKLDCHIDKETSYLSSGIKKSLVESISKHSATLNREVVYQRTSKICRLPKYLTVHFVRFFWRRDINKKAKIMKKVKFPFVLDTFEFLTAELQKRVGPGHDRVRETERKREEAEHERKRRKYLDGTAEVSGKGVEGSKICDTSGSAKSKTENTADNDSKVIDKTRGECITASYDLIGIITHQGASANGGHYIAWCKKTDASGEWWKFNDDKVSTVPESKIEELMGGGESDGAYVLLYRGKEANE